MFITLEELNSEERELSKNLFKVIRKRYISSVRAKGRSVVELEAGRNRFLEIMMDLCEEGEFTKLKRKITEAIERFAKRVGSANRGAAQS
jgi:hypothetical protein